MMNAVIEKAMQDGMSYEEYRTLIDDLFVQGKTTGPDQSEEMLHYTKLNIVRMKRIDKTTVVQDDVREAITNIQTPQTWLVITEAWCGDAAQIVPVINVMASLNPQITLKHVLRDENEELMDLFLTNGGKSIPKVVVIDKTANQVIGDWGPRPSEMQEMVMARKNNPNATPYSEFVIEAQKWYAKEKTVSIQREFVAMLGERSVVDTEG